MDEEYQGDVKVSGEDYSAQPTESKRHFKSLLAGLFKTKGKTTQPTSKLSLVGYDLIRLAHPSGKLAAEKAFGDDNPDKNYRHNYPRSLITQNCHMGLINEKPGIRLNNLQPDMFCSCKKIQECMILNGRIWALGEFGG
ncbi:hypothetical protein M8C21_025063, partial [Ambrosia artemisiifolia]